MAITQTDLNISNISYTNKDFESIYTELMDIATKISYKYKPAQSNESDPFIVLLKLLAFVGDKVDYNVDKNILERFLTSATQDKSVRELTSMLGYNMKYYQAATTEVVCKYNYNGSETYPEGSKSSTSYGIYIPQFTKFTDSTGTIMFVSKEEAYINLQTKSSSPIVVIQGNRKTLSVLDNDVITLNNLDENLRIYFPEAMVAENAVFIKGGSSDNDTVGDLNWKLVDNLNSVKYGSYSYVFGYDSDKKLPYIQFPNWISSIIGSGLTIDYIVTDGVNGNVSAKAITTITLSDDYLPIYETLDLTATSDNIVVVNSIAAGNGEDPETINEAYKGFKKTIGTFDTLVTCRDYANAIYNAINDDNSANYVSNIQVSDRRTDLNYGCSVCSFTETGPQNISIISTNIVNSVEVPKISAYDLCLYPFTYTNDMEYSTVSSSYDGYDKSFTALSNINPITKWLEEKAPSCISHDYKNFSVGDIYAIKNYSKLEAVISTTTKVNAYEQTDIIMNINNALAKKFNARQVDFGYEIPYDIILSTIESADSRIKSVSLYEPNLTSKGYVVKSLNQDGSINEMEEREIKELSGGSTVDSTWFKTVVAKNILSGKVEMLNYNTLFNYNYGESSANLDTEVNTFTSTTGIGTISVNTEHELNSGEVLEFISPNYITDGSVYPYGINYHLELANDVSRVVKILPVTETEGVRAGGIVFSNSGKSVTITYNNNLTETINATTSLSLQISRFEINSSSTLSEVNTFINSADTYKQLIAVIDGSSTVFSYREENVENSFIPKNSVYRLSTGDKLIMQWTNSSEQSEEKVYIGGADGQLIKPNFNMYTTQYKKSQGKTPLIKKLSDGNNYEFFTLETSDEVTPVKVNSQSITSKKGVYWHLNNSENRIVWGGTNNDTYVLEDGEYFFYTDVNFSELYSFGAGFMLKKTGFASQSSDFWKMSKVSDIILITETNIDALKQIFNLIDFTSNDYITLTEQEIVTIVAGDFVKPLNGAFTVSDNNFAAVDNGTTIQYKLSSDEDWTTLVSKPDAWKARAILDLCAGPDLQQTLEGSQTIVFKNGVGTTVRTLNSGTSFKLSVLKQITGGVDKTLKYTNLSLKTAYPALYSYTYNSPVSYISTSSSVANNNYYSVVIPSSKVVTLKLPSLTGYNTFIMLYATLLTDEKITLPSSGVECYNKTLTENNEIIQSGIYILKTSLSDLTLTFSSTNIYCIVSKPRIVSSSVEINPLLGLESSTNIKSFITSNFAKQWEKFNVVNFMDNTRGLELSETYKLSSPELFYDVNNIANKWMIPVIDINNSTITIARSSQRAD